MIDLIIVLLLLTFLAWFLFPNASAFSLAKLGEVRSNEAFIRQKETLYTPFHKVFFKERPFDFLILSYRMTSFIGLIGFVAMTLVLLQRLDPFLGKVGETVLGLFLLFFGLGLGYLLPFLIQGEKSLIALSPYTNFFHYLSTPIVLPLLKLSESIFKRLKKPNEENLEEMKETVVTLLQRANVRGRLNPLEKKLIESVLIFKDRIVREVMIPRVNVFSLPVDMKIKEAAGHLVHEGYSRIPVYRESVDNVIGILMFKDVLDIYRDCELGNKDRSFLEKPIEVIIKRVFYTPETKKVSQLLQEFRVKKVHMAIVVDEYGGTEGVVTLEDLLEEIVGDIGDEYDVGEETLFSPEPGGNSWIVDARMSILDAEAAFGIHIPQLGDYDTIGGYIFEKLGTIPKKGEILSHNDFDIEILLSTARNIEKVEITKKKPPAFPL